MHSHRVYATDVDDTQAWMQVKSGRQTVDLGGGLRAPKTLDVDVHIPDYEEVKIRVHLVLGGGVYGVTKLTVVAEGDRAVSTELLRLIPIRTITTRAVESALELENMHPRFRPDGSWDEVERARFTAVTYRRARLLGEPPLRAVMKTEKVSQSTASRRVAAARAAGFLGPGEIGRAGGAQSKISNRSGT